MVISPLVPPQTIDSDVHDHASIPATVKEVYGLPSFLTKRDTAAKTLTNLCSLTSARGAPLRLPRPAASAMIASAVTQPESQSMNDLQVELLALARELGGFGAPLGAIAGAPPLSQGSAAAEIRQHLLRFKEQ